MSRVRGASAIALVALSITACGTNANAPGMAGGKSGGVVYDYNFPPAAAWALETDDAFTLSQAGCLETLVRYDADGRLQPALATSWKQKKPTAWDFTLRNGVKFQDGTPMNADAVVGALTHLLKATAPARSFSPKVVTGVKAIDAGTVRITTAKPDALMPLRMASPNTGILAPKAYAGRTIDITGTCTGPFTVVSQVSGQSLSLKRNESYWRGPAKIATAQVRFITNGATRATQVQTGEAQIAASVPATSRSSLSADNKIKLISHPQPRTASLLLNDARPPFNNPTVRKALQYAIDLKSIVASVYNGAASPAAGPFSPADPWAAKGAQPVAYNLTEAKQLLAQAGVDPASLKFQLIAYHDRPEFADLATVIQAQLAKIGIKVTIKTGDYASFEPDLLAGKFDGVLMSRNYLMDMADPAGYLLSDWACGGSYNIAHYCDKKVDALIQRASANQDMNARYALYAQIAQQLQNDAAGVFLVQETNDVAVNADIQNFQLHPLNYYVLTNDLAVAGK